MGGVNFNRFFVVLFTMMFSSFTAWAQEKLNTGEIKTDPVFSKGGSAARKSTGPKKKKKSSKRNTDSDGLASQKVSTDRGNGAGGALPSYIPGAFTKGTGGSSGSAGSAGTASSGGSGVSGSSTGGSSASSKTGGASSSGSSGSTTQSGSSAGSSGAGSLGPNRAAFGGSSAPFCIGPSKCDGSETASAPNYTWQIPYFNGVGAIGDAYLTLTTTWNEFEQPKAVCDASKAGQMMAIDFGGIIGKRAVICMSGGELEGAFKSSMVDKLKTADVSSLPIEIANVRDQYQWKMHIEPSIKNVGAVCSGLSTCSIDNVGQTATSNATYCGTYICTKTPGHSVYAAADAGSNSSKKACADWEAVQVKSCVNGREYGKVSSCLPAGYDNPQLWVRESDGSYSHQTGKTCVDQCADWKAAEVLSCNNGLEYGVVRGCKPEGFDNPLLWVAEADGSYSHQTGRSCVSQCADWKAVEVLSCSSGVEFGVVRGCKPEGFDNPLLWVAEADGSYSHRTGRSCEQRSPAGGNGGEGVQ